MRAHHADRQIDKLVRIAGLFAQSDAPMILSGASIVDMDSQGRITVVRERRILRAALFINPADAKFGLFGKGF